MDSPIMFKNAVGGFDKKEVIKYIFELNESSQAAQKRLGEQLEEITQAREALDHQLAEADKKTQRMQSEVSNVREELAGEKKRVSELTRMLEKLSGDVDRYKGLLGEKEQELRSGTQGSEEVRGKMRSLEERCASQSAELERLRGEIAIKEREIRESAALQEKSEAKLRALDEQKQEVERSTVQVGRLLLTATTDAEKIRADAYAEAEQIVFRGRVQAEEALAKAGEEVDEIISEAKRQAELATADANRSLVDAQHGLSEFMREVEALQNQIYGVVDSMRAKTDQVGELVGQVGKRLLPEKPVQDIETVEDDEDEEDEECGMDYEQESEKHFFR